MAETAQEIYEFKSLKEFKNNLGLQDLDTNNDDFFQEHINLKITKNDFDALKKSLEQNNAERLVILKECIRNWSVIVQETVKDKTALKTQIDKLLANFEVKAVKDTIKLIESIPDPQEKIFLANYMLSELEDRWYAIYIKWDKVEVCQKKNNNIPSNNLQDAFNNSIQSWDLKIDTIKNAILYRTSNIDNFVWSKTNLEWNKIVEGKLDADTYYKDLLKKYNLDSVFGPSKEDIEKNPSIDQKDRAFLISYIKWSYENYPIDQSIKQLKEEIKIKVEKAEYLPEPIKRRWHEIDNRSMNEKVWDFLKNPFWELNGIMWKAWWIWALAILWAIIYGMWKYPKQAFWGIAVWGLAKWLWVMDEIWKAFDWEYNQDIASGSKKAWNWTTEKFKSIPWASEEVIERWMIWYKFSNYQFKFGNKQNDIIDSTFVDLYNSSDEKDFWDKVIRSDWKDITPEEKVDSVKSLKREINELYNEWVNKTWWDRNKFLQNIDGMSVKEVVDYVTDKPKKENSKQENQKQDTSNQSVIPSPKPDEYPKPLPEELAPNQNQTSLNQNPTPLSPTQEKQQKIDDILLNNWLTKIITPEEQAKSDKILWFD